MGKTVKKQICPECNKPITKGDVTCQVSVDGRGPDKALHCVCLMKRLNKIIKASVTARDAQT